MFQLSRNFIRNTVPAQTRLFSASTARFVKVGDSIPKAAVYEDSPGNQIDLAEETASGKSIIIGVPGAFSPACSSSHVPGFIKYLSKFEEKGYKKIL